MKRISFFYFALLVLFSLALFVRVYHIESIPAGLYPDEAVNGTDALKAKDTHDYRLFYENNNGREGLFINAQSFSISAFGNSIFALKLPSILLGAFTALFTGLLARELFASRAAGVIAMSLTAFSYWAINFSRIGFRANAVPFFLASSFFFFLLGLRRKNIWQVATAGALFGLGLHTYIAYRIAPLPLLALLLLYFAAEKDFFKKNLVFLEIFFACAFLSSAPLLWDFFVTHPEHFASRSGSISVFSAQVNGGHFWSIISETIAQSIGKYFLWGDQNWRHNLPPYPILDPLSAFAFLMGLCVMFWKSVVAIKQKIIKSNFNRDLVAFPFLLVWFVALLAPEFLTYEGNPHALRSIGTLPAVYIIAAYPLAIMWRRQVRAGRKTIITIILVLLLLYSATWNIYHYFYTWASSAQSRSAFDERYTKISGFINALPKENTIYVIANGHGQKMDDGLPVSAYVIRYLTYGKSSPIFLTPENIPSTFSEKALIVLMDHNPWIADTILRDNPGSRIKTVSPYEGLNGDDSSFSVIFIR